MVSTEVEKLDREGVVYARACPLRALRRERVPEVPVELMAGISAGMQEIVVVLIRWQ